MFIFDSVLNLHLRTNVNDLDVGKLKNLSDIIDNEVSKKVNKLEKKIPDGATLIHINQYNTKKQI